ncbi:MAG: AMP-binding protein [Alphaproteobacteria bacterium]|nr:AMP-binding protein [Alphaproteobacteria bacterium]
MAPDQEPDQKIAHDLDHTDRVVAWRDGRAISRSGLLRDAAKLAHDMPNGRRIANSCSDQYHFLVVFLAALMRGQTVILPHAFDTHILAELAGGYPGLLFVTDRPRHTEPLDELTVAFDGTSDWLEPDFPDPKPDAPVASVFSSGSTGRPVPTHRTWKWMTTGVEHYAAAFGLDRMAAYNMVATVPSQHAFGLETAVFLTLCHRAAINTTIPLYPADVVAALEQIPSPRVLVTTPVHLRVLVESRVTTPDVSLVLSATAPLQTSLAGEAEAMLGAPVMEVYGCTEIGLIATRRTVDGEAWTLPHGMHLRASGHGMRIDAAHLSEPVMLADGFQRLSDTTVEFKGRRNDIVKVAGKRASLSGLDAALNSIDGVIDGVYLPPSGGDAPANQRLTACVVIGDGDVDRIRRALRAKVASTFVPRPLIPVARIPRNGTGKVRYAELRALAQSTAQPAAQASAQPAPEPGE